MSNEVPIATINDIIKTKSSYKYLLHFVVPVNLKWLHIELVVGTDKFGTIVFTSIKCL